MADLSAPEIQKIFKVPQERQKAESFSRTIGEFNGTEPYLLPYIEGMDDPGSEEVKLSEKEIKEGLHFGNVSVQIDGTPEKVYSPNTPMEAKLSGTVHYKGRRVTVCLKKEDLFSAPAKNPKQETLDVNHTSGVFPDIPNPEKFPF